MVEILQKAIKSQLKKIFQFMVAKRLYWPLAAIYVVFFIRERHPDKTESRVIPLERNKDKIPILALGAEGFRGDLEALAEAQCFRVLRINRPAQFLLLYKAGDKE